MDQKQLSNDEIQEFLTLVNDKRFIIYLEYLKTEKQQIKDTLEVPNYSDNTEKDFRTITFLQGLCGGLNLAIMKMELLKKKFDEKEKKEEPKKEADIKY